MHVCVYDNSCGLAFCDAARHNRTCGKSTARPHVRARAVNVR